ncbi:MAG: cupin domain-containing protein [Proteobacteria bacterium]|nr:cupin domain-containing protein [Pseudomonadota bacterium]
MSTTEQLAASDNLETLYGRLHERSIGAGWAKPTPSLYPEPYKNFEPFLWSWQDGRAALDAAGRLIGTDLAERRNLILYNPVEGNDYATVRTLIAAYQMILPGEQARSHRHTPNALRFIIEGEGSYTIVNGERLPMHPNDVLLTPNWCWHGHASEAEGACYWMDCLDVPLVHFLEPMFFEQHPDIHEPVAETPLNSPFLFAWADVQKQLDQTEIDPEGRYGRRIELGSPALHSIALHMNRLESGSRTRTTRTTANQIICVAEGAGTSVIDGQSLNWQRGDVFAVPGWRPFHHKATGDATLFEMSDEPVMRSLGWLRTSD